MKPQNTLPQSEKIVQKTCEKSELIKATQITWQ